jgi:hypothetical protein
MAKSEKTGISHGKPKEGLHIAVELKKRSKEHPKELGGLEGLGKWEGVLRLLPLIEELDLKGFAELLEKARHMNPKVELPDYSGWHQIITPAGLDPDKLVKALRKLEIVETAYVMRPAPPPVNPNDPLRIVQGYLNAGKNGINAKYAWRFPGGDGDRIGFVDMEGGWNLEHEDLVQSSITLISGFNRDHREHGTAVLGEVLMFDNEIGGVGIAPGAKGRVISHWRTKTSPSPNYTSAIVKAVQTMDPGDVLLLEAQDLAPLGAKSPDEETGEEAQAKGYWPIEVAKGTYKAIKDATDFGIVVIEAAGNSRNDLDTYKSEAGERIFDTAIRDSGAIIVGAGTKASPHAPTGETNRGKRVDCYAWGEQIATTTSDEDGTDNSGYRLDFDGTSGASAIIAGAALIVQGLAQAKLGRRYSPQELRQILTTNGTPSDTPASDGIGVMPDLKAIIIANNLAP